MRFYLEKPIRVDYYPKTSENIDESEGPEIEDGLDREAVCEVAGEKGLVGEEAAECSERIEEDVEVMEKAVKEVAGDIETVMKKVVRCKK